MKKRIDYWRMIIHARGFELPYLSQFELFVWMMARPFVARGR